MFTALMYRASGDPELPIWEERVKRIVLQSDNIALRIKIGPIFLMYYTWFEGNLKKGEVVFNAIRVFGELPDMPALVLTTWHFMAAGYSWMAGELIRALNHADTGLKIANESGVHIWDLFQ